MLKMFRLLLWLPLLAACSGSESVQEQVADPQVGDVYVVQFQPQGSPAPRYYFYHLFRVAPDSVYLHPARQDSPSPDADLRQLAFEPTPKTIVYTRAELRELLELQPGDVTKSHLIQVRRP
ncbi:hypothetical protein [Hymenobacter canadensis]|uniref:Uncharacterized protein n=1 Tax=Hymenobacter canadensis TaxID=2999067 RepID=A0ABY7LTS0_9BACT|nr:hypothetical protein [Hymenobacter canadensis]WBA42090.1 hypothetical protein O3303_00695 [Hymenobacter canadensis]